MSTNGVEIYREIADPSSRLLAWLENRNQLWVISDPKGNEHLFIDNDTPRDPDITIEIVTRTVGFALFTEDGDYIGSYRSLDRAITAQQGAKLVVQADVEGVEPDEDVFDEHVPEDLDI